MSAEIVNKIAQSGIITIDLEKYYPNLNIDIIDLKDFLFMGQILKEKHFREQLAQVDWSSYKGKSVIIILSIDTLIPNWAYMLFASLLQPYVEELYIGTKENFLETKILYNIQRSIIVSDFEDARVVIKGCGDKFIPASAYSAITQLLRPVAKSIMYGEPCSTVPVYKKKA